MLVVYIRKFDTNPKIDIFSNRYFTIHNHNKRSKTSLAYSRRSFFVWGLYNEPMVNTIWYQL